MEKVTLTSDQAASLVDKTSFEVVLPDGRCFFARALDGPSWYTANESVPNRAIAEAIERSEAHARG